MKTTACIELEIRVTGFPHPVRIGLGDHGDRWVAAVEHGTVSTSGLGGNARQALVAALMPLGPRVTTAVMAAPAMFAASVQLLSAAAV